MFKIHKIDYKNSFSRFTCFTVTMATRGKKKMVSKDDLRQMMKQHGASKAASKKIDSPLAKYNSIGQLVCIVCNSQVKSELLWSAHLQGRTHKENFIRLRKVQQQQQVGQATTKVPGGILKRKSDETLIPETVQKIKKTSENSHTKGLQLGNYGNSSSESEEEATSAPKPSTSSALPSDFFDNNISVDKKRSEITTEPKVPQAMSEQLPEGFFDDPKEDAKVRQIEYKDKMDEEWELFQRSMKEETTVSEQIREEDEAQATVERNIDEIDEQIHRWSKVNQLQEKKEKLKQNPTETEVNVPSDSEADDDDFDEFLNWRAKNAWK